MSDSVVPASFAAPASLLQRLIERGRRWWFRPHELRELEAGQTMDSVARDIGLPIGQLLNLVRRSHRHGELMPAMVRQNGIDLKALEKTEPALVRDMERVCALCTDLGKCQHDLAAGTGAAHYQEYCLNSGTIDALKADPGIAKAELPECCRAAGDATAAPIAPHIMPSCCG